MSRIDFMHRLYNTSMKKDSRLFNFDKLRAPQVLYTIIPESAIQEIYKISTSIRYNADVDQKYEKLDAIMRRYGFFMLARGTNRSVYVHPDLQTIVVKVATDRIGMKDGHNEMINQEYLKPFCTKTFDVHPTGVISVHEKVQPITSMEEFLTIKDDIFYLTYFLSGKYVIDDAGLKYFMNYGLRYLNNGSFGPVLLDYPSVFLLDDRKLICMKPLESPNGIIRCGGLIDFDNSLSSFSCQKCGKTYTARELSKENEMIGERSAPNIMFIEGKKTMGTVTIKDDNGNIIKIIGAENKTTISQTEYKRMISTPPKAGDTVRMKVERVTKRMERQDILQKDIEACRKLMPSEPEPAPKKMKPAGKATTPVKEAMDRASSDAKKCKFKFSKSASENRKDAIGLVLKKALEPNLERVLNSIYTAAYNYLLSNINSDLFPINMEIDNELSQFIREVLENSVTGINEILNAAMECINKEMEVHYSNTVEASVQQPVEDINDEYSTMEIVQKAILEALRKKEENNNGE